MRRHVPLSALIALAAAAGATLVTASSAAADDAGLFATYNARQPTDLAAANAEYKRAARVVRRSDGRRGGRAVIRANHRINAGSRRRPDHG
jgi:hypothetical protein